MNKELEDNKYVVLRSDKMNSDGTVDMDPSAQYFVLRIDQDPAARIALRTYAKEMHNQGEFKFATQLEELADKYAKPTDGNGKTRGKCPVCGSMELSKYKLETPGGVVANINYWCTNCGIMLKFIP